MNRPLRLLFLTPSAGRTGSEMALWNVLHRFDRSRFQAAVYCERPGPLLPELPPDVPGFTSPFQGSPPRKLWAKMRHGAGIRVYEKFIDDLTHSFRPDAWYINTINMAYHVHSAKRLGVPVVGHVHEISHLLYQDVSALDMAALVEYARLLLCGSGQVRDELQVMGANRVEVLYPPVDLTALQPDLIRAQELRRGLGIADTDFVWLMSGTPIYRKGLDRVPAIARRLPPHTHLIWTGGIAVPNASFFLVQKQLEREDRGNVHFVGAQTTDYANYLAAANGFVLTSREEAFGMVNVEAAYLGKPIVSFDAGGIREIMTPGMGLIVPQGDVPGLVAAMKAVMDGTYAFDPAAARARALHFSSDRLIGDWQRIVGSFL